MEVAIVYDRVNKWGGAERVLLTLHEMFPEAPLYTSVYSTKRAPWAKVFPKVYTSFLQKFPFAAANHEYLAPFMPLAFESFDFSGYDLVISVTSEAAKGIITKPETRHLCYLLTPTRYLWSGYHEYFQKKLLRLFSHKVVTYLRKWDKIAAQRPDKIVAISTEVKNRIKKYYGRDSKVIFPPVDSHRKNSELKIRNYYLVVSRLVPYKKVDLVVRTFNKLALPLVVVGTGSQRQRLRLMARRIIKFVGEVSDEKLVEYYQGAKALIVPQEEDFGIVSVEAQSFGVPVIAYGQGGSVDTVIDGKTGILFPRQTVDSMAAAVAQFEKTEYNRSLLFDNAKRFSKEVFKKKMTALIDGIKK